MKTKQYRTEICGCFLTLKDEENLKAAQKHLKTRKVVLADKDLKLKRAKEPSNYIWENMHHTRQHQNRNKCWILVLFSLLLVICYKIQYKFQYETTYLGVFEEFDCELYHNSLPSQNFFNENDVKNTPLDAATIKKF